MSIVFMYFVLYGRFHLGVCKWKLLGPPSKGMSGKKSDPGFSTAAAADSAAMKGAACAMGEQH